MGGWVDGKQVLSLLSHWLEISDASVDIQTTGPLFSKASPSEFEP